MERRTFLSWSGISIASATSGCTGFTADGQETGDRTVDGTRRSIAVVEVDSLPDALQVDVDASVENALITGESPGIVEIAVTNEGTERHFGIGPGARCGPFNREQGASSPPGLWLEIPERSDYAHPFNTLTRPPDRWTFDVSPDRNRTFLSYECGGRQFAGGETVTYRYQVWDDYKVEGYLVPGNYRFNSSIKIGSEQNAWSFELAVRKPDST